MTLLREAAERGWRQGALGGGGLTLSQQPPGAHQEGLRPVARAAWGPFVTLARVAGRCPTSLAAAEE